MIYVVAVILGFVDEIFVWLICGAVIILAFVEELFIENFLLP